MSSSPRFAPTVITTSQRNGTPAANADAQPAERLSRTLFLGTLALLVGLALFGTGVHFAHKKYWPYKPMAGAWTVLKDAVHYGGFAPENAVGEAPDHASRKAWKVHDAAAVLPGYRAVMGYSRELADFAIWIFDTDGNEVHRRVLNYYAEDPDGPSGGSEAPHAFHFLPDGSAVVNTDKGDLLARYDTCGDAIWARHGPYHHSLASDPEGGLWTWRGENSAFAQYQYLVRFDPQTGETLEEIGLVEDILEASQRNRTIFAVVPGHTMQHERGYRTDPDLFHPNDIEVLQPSMAAAFPQFDVGDLLLSFRNVDLVTVLDPDTLEIKWWSHGPWRQQHDPDFTASGNISVFNNNRSRAQSSIVLIDPQTNAVQTRHIEPDYRFYTSYMGKHEYLHNGILQVAVPYEGRALEFNPDGSLVLEINNLFSEQHNAFVSDYTWLPADFFTTAPDQFECNQSGDTPL